jgi:isopenicillin N synthase-like dioxygenase
MMQVWSNGKYKAPVHRVLANHSESRFSIPFFLNPSYTFVVEPLEDVTGGITPKYRPILWGEFRSVRVQGDYADYGEEIQISQYEII